jgi:hypothetical protein
MRNKVFIWTGAILALLAMVVFVVPFGLPARYNVVRTTTINAQPADIHPSVNTLKEWPKWSAWTSDKYPDMKITYSGPESGVGAIDEFEGESVGGHGRFEITKSDPDDGIEYTLDFDRGTYVSTGAIKYTPAEAGGTTVTWSNGGDLGWNPISRWCGALGLMDSVMGPDFETGLANLKKNVEAEVAAAKPAEEQPPAEEPATEPVANEPETPAK